MKKNLMAILNKMQREELLSLIEQLCENSETERLLKLLIAPTKADLNRALNKFETCCDCYAENSCSDRTARAVLAAAEPLYAACQNADAEIGAYIRCNMQRIAEDHDLRADEVFDFGWLYEDDE